MKKLLTPEEDYLAATETNPAAPFTKLEAAAMFARLERRLQDRIPAVENAGKMVTRATLAKHFGCGVERIGNALAKAGVTGLKVGYATRYPFAETCERIAPYLNLPIPRFSA